ncbi:MAG: prepilin-type N-terminal cleavage/methylation domain-containing protein [Candidatus Gottesmanbacteria bacterium]|nr:prepilin-type N-terminal cleavage/methylation domain-containing protein [Candidatus Gottesmanbacteria bacterium]
MKSTRGFTLIELLIVIALLGALAVGLLATIDPFEQLKKGRDTSQRNTVSELYNANLRYYSTKAQFPFGTGGLATTSVDTLTSTINALISAGELKNNFMGLAGTGNLAKIFITSTGAEAIAVCYRPESKGFQIDPNTVYDISGNGRTGCISQATGGASGATCYYCIQ